MKVSWIILTWNRAEIVQRAVTHNMANAGRQWDELIWVDNGSHDGIYEWAKQLEPTVLVRHKENMGVSKGYNRGLVLATGDLLVITGCDMLMPDNWLKTFVEHFEKIPDTGVASMYSGPLDWVPERARKGGGWGKWVPETVNGLNIIPAMPIGRRMFRREMLKDFGYFHEGFGLYGHEDVHWGHRAEKICDEKGLRYYVIPDQICHHLGTEGIRPFDGMDSKGYHDFKQNQVKEDYKGKLLSELEKKGWPYFTPYV